MTNKPQDTQPDPNPTETLGPIIEKDDMSAFFKKDRNDTAQKEKKDIITVPNKKAQKAKGNW